MVRFGIARCVASALAADGMFIALLPLSNHLAWLLALRALMGISLATLFMASETWIALVTADGNRARVMGVYNATLSISFGLGPAIIAIAGIDGWAPFATAVNLVVLARILLPFAARYAPTVVEDADAKIWSVIREAPLLILAVLLVAVLYGGAWALLPVYGVRIGLGTVDAATLLSAVAVGGVLMQFPIGWIGDRLDRIMVLRGCALISALSVLVLPWFLDSVWVNWLVLFVWGGSFIAIYTMALALGGDQFRGVRLALLMAAFGVIWGVGNIVGPLLGGFAMQQWDPHGFIVVLVGLPVAWLCVSVRWRTLR
ncbi:MAG: MFS transporter [Chromatiales bacterium]|jgi:MFS family permease|nr:MFS transporter [Chromatiales bacterium]